MREEMTYETRRERHVACQRRLALRAPAAAQTRRKQAWFAFL